MDADHSYERECWCCFESEDGICAAICFAAGMAVRSFSDYIQDRGDGDDRIVSDEQQHIHD
jgi:hypothetical protein